MADENKSVVFQNNTPVENVFTDIIEVSVNNETAQLKIGLRSLDGETAIASHNIILTLPHFLRLANAIKTSTEDILKQIKVDSDDNTNT